MPTCSSHGVSLGARRRQRAPALLALVALLPGAAAGTVFETQEQALSRAFPAPARVVRATSFLSPEQVESARKAAQAPVDSAVVTRYAAFGPDGMLLGTAYFDSHVVRTASEVLMIVVSPDRTIRSVDVLAFGEPQDYLPRAGWLKRAEGKRTEDGLFVGRALAHVTGATMTTRAIAAAVRRVLAIHALLEPPAPPAK
ncbi:MAG: FMN-binding protein [Deltaproteobacteria bacterium]|nr:FMN-binding protein [Deltaproteobacteria bacterium]